jgi:2,4-dienoyl-CoA reductase-like NADH-dependent reductase (Old Yellow Enzyme family)
MRFALEVTDGVRAVWPAHKPLFFRVSARDGRGGLWDLDDTVALSVELKRRGVDVIDCSSGGITGGSTMPVVARKPGYHVEFSARIKREAKMHTMVVGLITKATQAEEILRTGDADLIALARELMYNSDWPVHAARELGCKHCYELFPPAFGFRLRRRDEVSRLPFAEMGPNVARDIDSLIEST